MKLFCLGRRDLALSLAFFLIGFAGSHVGAGYVNLTAVQAENVWFHADIGRVLGNMTERRSNHYRTKVHPIFSLATHPAVHVVHKLGMGQFDAVRLLVAVTAGIWLAAVFLVLRLLHLKYLDAILFSTLTAVSASALFWATVPETYLFGSLTMLIVLGFARVSGERAFSPIWYVGLSALSLSMTVTNWMTGILTTLANHPWRQSLRITLDAFLLITVLWAVQHALYPSSEFFLFSAEERRYVLPDEGGGVVEKTVAFFLHPMVMPAVQFLENPMAPDWPFLSVQFATIGSSGLLGFAMTLAWSGLLGVGAWTALRTLRQTPFGFVLGLTLLGQFALHLVYGDETFLYSLHWLPFLVLLAAVGVFSGYRRQVLLTVTILIIGTAFNNFQQFTEAAAELNSGKYGSSASERSRLRATIKQHPNADWPRSEGHAVLANAGSPLSAKGYHEPGGNFSPGFGSFGISFAFFDREGKLEFSSNTLPLDQIEQALDPEKGAIATTTPYYFAEWRTTGIDQWRLRFVARSLENGSAALRVSSAGPAGAPVVSVSWDGHRLTVNDVHTMEFSRMPEKVLYLDERISPTLSGETNTGAWAPDDGYGSVLLVLEEEVEHQVDVATRSETYGSGLPKKLQNTLRVDLPDKRFSDSLFAQIYHMKAGLIGEETRPGDPGNYDVNWLRDGAYIIVALVRAGELQLARRLAEPFAMDDYFGGFGAEADAPGLAIWVLDEISARLRRPEYDRHIWPHVLRKANLILEMLAAETVIFGDFSGPIVPDLRNRKYSELSEVAQAAKNGLIDGKMDKHRPIFYINAVAYMGLTHAAALAERMGFRDKTEELRNRALELRLDWGRALESHPDRKNPRTLVGGLHPTMIAKGEEDAYRALLEEKWLETRTADGEFVASPKWTYFDVAESHQWLLLGDPQRAWSTLDWFWRHQVSPGLYTWWEGTGEENTFHRWENVRGWHEPRHVSPHYWTAAEVALLQLDMLAYEIIDEQVPTIVLGAGVPKSWLEQPFAISGLSLRHGTLDWNWDGEAITVVWHGDRKPRFITGPAFPKSVTIRVSTKRLNKTP